MSVSLFVPWVVFHVVICFALIIVVLMQSAKGEGLAGGTAFGGGVSNAVFGGRGAASFLSKATTFLAVVFFVNCGALALMSSNSDLAASGSGDGTVVESSVTRQAQADREQALQRQQAQQEAILEDSLAQQNAQPFNLDSIAVGGSEETSSDDATSDN